MNELQRVIKNLKFGSDLKDFVEAPDYLISLCEKLIDPNIKKLAVFMDKDVSTSSLIVFLYSVAHLSDGFTTYMKEFADRNLEVGDRVKVLPGKHVYEYAGIVESAPYLMWLNIVGDKFAKRTLPISEIARLEKTDSERPKGKLNTPIEEEDRSAQDIVLGPDVSTYGNLDIFPNICLVLGKTNSLKQSFNNLRVREKSFPVTLPLSEIYPFGAVSYNGQVLSSDVNQTEQSPIIAVSASYERISNASLRNTETKKTIIYDGIEKLEEEELNLPVSSNHKEILLLSLQDLPKIDLIKEKGFELEILNHEKILEGKVESEVDLITIFDQTFRKAQNRQNLGINFKEVRFTEIELLYETMILTSEVLDEHPDPFGEEIFLSSMGLFYDFCDACLRIPKSVVDKRRNLELKISMNVQEENVKKQLLSLIESFKKVESAMEGKASPKWYELVEIMRHWEHEDPDLLDHAVVTRNPLFGEGTEDFEFTPHFAAMNVLFSSIDSYGPWEEIFVLGWPNKKKFEKFWHSYPGKNITFITYHFERDLFLDFLLQQERMLSNHSEEFKLAGMNDYLSSALVDHKKKKSIKKEPLNVFNDKANKILQRVEERIRKKDHDVVSETDLSFSECKLAFFSGVEAYSWVSSNHKFDVLDELFDGSGNSLIGRKTLSELEEGNLVLFREKGERDVLSMLAEESIGTSSYADLRAKSQFWRSALISLGGINEAKDALAQKGFGRTDQTLANWIKYESVIAPSSKEDIDIINLTVKEEFKFDVDDCHLAAEKIRSLHQSAGSTLTKRLLSEIELNPPNLESGLTKLNLGFGDFWIAEFSKFLKDKRFKPISELNHLIHSEELEA